MKTPSETFKECVWILLCVSFAIWVSTRISINILEQTAWQEEQAARDKFEFAKQMHAGKVALKIKKQEEEDKIDVLIQQRNGAILALGFLKAKHEDLEKAYLKELEINKTLRETIGTMLSGEKVTFILSDR